MSWNSKVEYRHYSSNGRPCTHTCSHISSNISKNTTLLVFRLNTKNFFLNERYQLNQQSLVAMQNCATRATKSTELGSLGQREAMDQERSLGLIISPNERMEYNTVSSFIR